MPVNYLIRIRNVLGSRSCLLNLAFVLSICMGGWVTLSIAAETPSPQSPSPNLRSLSVTLGSKTILAKVADNDSSRTQGLLGWSSINEETGMLLEFPSEADYAIHMQGMKFPIDAIWIDSKGLIRLIYEDIQPN